MKIIKPGTPKGPWSKQVTCTGAGNGGGGCGAVLEVHEEDVYETWSSALHETYEYNTITCPECGYETDIGRVPFNPRKKNFQRDGWGKQYKE